MIMNCKKLLTANFDGACVDSLASQIRGLAHVSAGIFRISVKNIESHITKIVCFAEAVSCLYSNSIHEPLIKIGSTLLNLIFSHERIIYN